MALEVKAGLFCKNRVSIKTGIEESARANFGGATPTPSPRSRKNLRDALVASSWLDTGLQDGRMRARMVRR